MRFTSQHKAINQKEYGKAVSPLRYDSLALILSWSIFVVYGKQSEKNKYICSSKRHSALYTFWDTTNYCYLCGEYGELAHLARALQWHCRGDRFESGILHFLYILGVTAEDFCF